ncbi:MAG TPA: phytanoyl-CoA dioxygenase family protein [Roseiflexaceae bacterium]|nr:phytanoyl-CoA dioxygenase family protein [Roseiflexaceae bacterium]
MTSALETMSTEPTAFAYEPYRLSVAEYVAFHEQGFLAVRGLVPQEDVDALNAHMDHLLDGSETIPGITAPSFTAPGERLQYWLRVHMLHRRLAIHERTLLHPRVLDVLEALIGPDVLALQSMLFFKQPGQPGQGYHQDSYYIPTFPDTLCGAWLALDRADEENGCLWMTVGSQHEPVYPDSDGVTANGHQGLSDIEPIYNASHTDETQNGLTRVARKYAGREVKVEADPGDVVFFGGHVLHRSHANRSARSRRAFVGHYCNARSWVPWNHGQPWEGESGNYLHILARGTTHLPYAQPQFGTPCAANQPRPAAGPMRPASMMPGADGMMTMTPHGDEHDE